jgi:hypothetical protein
MGFITPPTVSDGDTWTASNQNTVRNNLIELFPYANAGDIAVASSPTELDALSAASASGMVLMSDLTDPLKMKWSDPLTVSNNLVISSSIPIPVFSSSSASYVDVAYGSITITPVATSTIIVIANGLLYPSVEMYAQCLLDGVSIGNESRSSVAGYNVPFSVIGVQTSQTASSHAIKVQIKTGGSGTASLYQLYIMALAIIE